MRSSSNAKGDCESREENVVVNGVEGSGEIEKYKREPFCLLQARIMSLVMRSSAVSQEWNLR